MDRGKKKQRNENVAATATIKNRTKSIATQQREIQTKSEPGEWCVCVELNNNGIIHTLAQQYVCPDVKNAIM